VSRIISFSRAGGSRAGCRALIVPVGLRVWSVGAVWLPVDHSVVAQEHGALDAVSSSLTLPGQW